MMRIHAVVLPMQQLKRNTLEIIQCFANTAEISRYSVEPQQNIIPNTSANCSESYTVTVLHSQMFLWIHTM